MINLIDLHPKIILLYDMTPSDILDLTQSLIAIPSVSGNEGDVIAFLDNYMSQKGWTVRRIPTPHSHDNLLVIFGKPDILLTTHSDVVPAASELFTPRREGDTLYGRGACDAKGIIATMIATAVHLLAQGQDNFALLFVVGEEVGGCGALSACESLMNLGIKAIINGEPTEQKIMVGHKGMLSVKLTSHGKACHSGYPALGVDANKALIAVCHDILNHVFDTDPVLGETVPTIATLSGGTAHNIIPEHAEAVCSVRCAIHPDKVLDILQKFVRSYPIITLETLCVRPPVALYVPDGFETDTAHYCTDIPHFLPLNVPCVLYGPGSIHVAHTRHEHITLQDVSEGLEGYIRIVNGLRQRIV